MQYLHSLEIEDFQCFTSIVHSSFESTNGEKKANVLDETCDKKSFQWPQIIHKGPSPSSNWEEGH